MSLLSLPVGRAGGSCKKDRTKTNQNEKFSKKKKIKEMSTGDQNEKFSKTENMQKFANIKQKCAKPELSKDPTKTKENQKKKNSRTKPLKFYTRGFF